MLSLHNHSARHHFLSSPLFSFFLAISYLLSNFFSFRISFILHFPLFSWHRPRAFLVSSFPSSPFLPQSVITQGSIFFPFSATPFLLAPRAAAVSSFHCFISRVFSRVFSVRSFPLSPLLQGSVFLPSDKSWCGGDAQGDFHKSRPSVKRGRGGVSQHPRRRYLTALLCRDRERFCCIC